MLVEGIEMFAEKKCTDCGKVFEPHSGRQLRCLAFRSPAIAARLARKAKREAKAAKKIATKIAEPPAAKPSPPPPAPKPPKPPRPAPEVAPKLMCEMDESIQRIKSQVREGRGSNARVVEEAARVADMTLQKLERFLARMATTEARVEVLGDTVKYLEGEMRFVKNRIERSI